MQDFSPRDSVLALLGPISCCLPSSRQPNHDNLDPAPWYSPIPSNNNPADDQAYNPWDPSSSSRRPADLMSLHSTHGGQPRTSIRSPRARRRRGGGDVSGTGADTSSGLSRWTLIKAWVTGDAKGRIRLEESDGEMDGFEGEGGVEGLGVALGEGDARVLTPTEAGDVDWLERAGMEVGVGEDSFEGMGASPRLDGREEGHAAEEEERERVEGKAARRARRHARRRARELGLTVDEFDEGVAAGEIPTPEEEVEAGMYLSAHGGSGRHLASSHGASSSGSSRSGSRRHRSTHPSPHDDHLGNHDDHLELPPPRLARPRHQKRHSISASSDNPSEALSAGTSSSSRSRRSASTLATTAEEPRTPLVPDDGFTQEDWEAASARSGEAKKRRSRSQRGGERELSGVQEGAEELM